MYQKRKITVQKKKQQKLYFKYVYKLKLRGWLIFSAVMTVPLFEFDKSTVYENILLIFFHKSYDLK